MLDARSDFQRYKAASRTFRNIFTTPQGPFTRRPGTKYISSTKDSTYAARLITFEYSTSDFYVIEVGNLYMRFYRNGAQILSGASAYEIVTPFTTADLPYIQYSQSDNVMYLVDGSHWPQKLTRVMHDNWTIDDANIINGPFMKENTEDITITPSAITGAITLAASAAVFNPSHEDCLFEINQPRGTPVLSGSLGSNANSSSSEYFTGGYGFTTAGTWDATVTLERSEDSGSTWNPALAPLSSANFDNPSEEEETGAIYRIKMTNWVSGTCTYKLIIADPLNHGVVRITHVSDSQNATATVIASLVDTVATRRWREGYWSDYRGYPQTVEFHQQRLIFACSDNYPQTIWFGRADPDNYESFFEGTYDNSAFTVALEGQNPIHWILSQDYLVIGTSNSVGKYGEQGKPITPTSPKYSIQTRIGSTALRAVYAEESILYAERGGKKIREFTYVAPEDRVLLSESDLTVLSEDILREGGGVEDMLFQNRPNPLLWCILNDGTIAVLTYQKKQEVIAWATLDSTGGEFQYFTKVPSEDEDEIWAVVKRNVDGSDVYYIEQFQPINWGSDDDDCWFVDSGLSYDGALANVFSGLDHLEGKTVSVYADGIVCDNVVVDSGSVTINNAASKAIIGLPITWEYESMPLVAHPMDKDMSKKIMAIDFDFYKTGYCKYGNGEHDTELKEINFFPTSPTLSAQELYTSEYSVFRVAYPYGSMGKQTIYLTGDKPLPITVRSITPVYEVTPIG